MLRHLSAIATAILLAAPAVAHEFWLEPTAYRIAPGATVEARAINGEDFGGIEYSYSDGAYERSGIVAGSTRKPLTGAQGQKPAVQTAAAGEGLNILYHASPLNSLVYANYVKFERFLKGKRLDWGLAKHADLNLPEENIKEVYFRFAKALVAVGGGAGSDRAVGMPYELLALTNPYTDAGPIRVQLLLDGSPAAAGTPVFYFRKTAGSVTQIKLETGANGAFSLPAEPGEYLINAVHLAPPTEQIRTASKAHWMTLWASLTFAIE